MQQSFPMTLWVYYLCTTTLLCLLFMYCDFTVFVIPVLWHPCIVTHCNYDSRTMISLATSPCSMISLWLLFLYLTWPLDLRSSCFENAMIIYYHQWKLWLTAPHRQSVVLYAGHTLQWTFKPIDSSFIIIPHTPHR